MTHPPSIRSRRDIRGGIIHLLAELAALAGLLALAALLAWLLLLL